MLTATSLPLTFLFVQLVLSVVCTMGLSFVRPESKFHFSPPRWTRKAIMAVAPVSTLNVLGLVFNIYCLKLVDASYFQVARGLTLPMTVVLSVVTTGERPTWSTIASCALVTWGFTYSFLPAPFFGNSTAPDAVDEVGGATDATGFTRIASSEAPVLGMVLGCLSAAMIAIHAVLIKSALKKVDGRALDLAYWQNALSALALVPGILVSGEVAGFMRMLAGQEGSMHAFAIGGLVTGLVGFLICVAGLLSIKVTSPVTHMFSSAVRSVLQTFLGVWLFKDVLNASRVVSISLILAGSILYTYFKSKSFQAPPKPESAEMDEVKQPLTGRSKQDDDLEAELDAMEAELDKAEGRRASRDHRKGDDAV